MENNENLRGQGGPELYAAMLAVSQEVVVKKAVPESRGVNYKVQGWDDLVDRLNRACFKHRLLIVPRVRIVQSGLTGLSSQSGTAYYDALVQGTFEIVHADTGQSIEVEMPGLGRDLSDKGVSKAATSAMKYALLKLFLVRINDDEDADASNPEGYAPRPQPTSTMDDLKGVASALRAVVGEDNAKAKFEELTSGKKTAQSKVKAVKEWLAENAETYARPQADEMSEAGL